MSTFIYFYMCILTKFIWMHIITTKRINDFANQYPEAKQALFTWVKFVEKANWSNFNDIKIDYPQADMVGDDRFVFNIKGNHYRLIVRISFQYKNLMIKWFGRHREYDKIDARTV